LTRHDAATVVEAPGGFFQGEEDALRIGVEDPVVVLLGTIHQWLDDYVGGVRDHDVQSSDRLLRFVEEASNFGGA